jgi:TonB family protein
MNNLVNFLLESGISLSAFALVFLFFLRKETYFSTNRLFILFSVLFSLLLPLLAIPFYPSRPVTLPEVTVTPYRNLLETVIVSSHRLSVDVERFVISSRFLANLWTSGVLIMSVIFAVRIGQIMLIIKRGKVISEEGNRLVLTTPGTSPFSFMNFLFIPVDHCQIPGYDRILKHEKEHIRQGHTWDILLIDILLIFQWFNPFIWLLKRAVRENHEYLVDRAVISSGIHPDEYKKLLLSEVAGSPVYAAHHFNYSLLKNRFRMMTKLPSGRMAGIKTMSGLLVAAALVVIFACEQKKTNSDRSDTPENLSIEFNDDILKISGSAEVVNKVDSLLRSGRYQLATSSMPDENRSMIILKKGEKNADTGMSPDSKDIAVPASGPAGKDQVFNVVEEMPEFPGGESALRKYIGSVVDYPASAKEKGIQGKVYISFVVSSDGTVKDARVVRGVDPALDKEALRVVNSLPRWFPGKQKGLPVSVAYTVPINFVLQ